MAFLDSTPGLDFSGAVSGIESGGSNNPYGLLGPTTKSGDQAYGKYQVMGANVPGWTKQYYGTQLTPQQFLQNPQAQEAVFNGKFGEYVNKYGPEGAARAWFAGEKGMNNPNASDVNGMTVQRYGQLFHDAMAPPMGPPQTVAGAGPQISAAQAPPQAAPPQQAPPGQQPLPPRRPGMSDPLSQQFMQSFGQPIQMPGIPNQNPAFLARLQQFNNYLNPSRGILG
jgi:hypothetical protein